MALDDQLAALAAGELDDDTARALRARAANDPALARRMARHARLQELLDRWDTPPMSEAAAQRLDARIDEALTALGDEPLTSRTTGAPAALGGDRQERSEPAGVVDLGRARRRREAGPGPQAATAGGGTFAWPGWAAGAAVAAVLAAVVGTGLVMGGLPGGLDTDVVAGGDESAEDSAEVTEEAGPESFSDQALESGPADGGEAQDEAAADAPVAEEDSAALDGPVQQQDVELAEGELLALLDQGARTTSTDSGGEDADAADTEEDDGGGATASEPGQQCVDEALRRDTAQADDRDVWLLAEGTYADRDAVFVVVRTPQPGGEDRFDVLAYDPADCSLLASDDALR